MCFLDIFKEAHDSNKAERQIPVCHCLVSPGDASVGSATWGGGPPPEEERRPPGLGSPLAVAGHRGLGLPQLSTISGQGGDL